MKACYQNNTVMLQMFTIIINGLYYATKYVFYAYFMFVISTYYNVGNDIISVKDRLCPETFYIIFIGYVRCVMLLLRLIILYGLLQFIIKLLTLFTLIDIKQPLRRIVKSLLYILMIVLLTKQLVLLYYANLLQLNENLKIENIAQLYHTNVTL